MDGDKTSKAVVKRPEVLRKLNTESLLAIERGLLGDLPDKLKPRQNVRGRPTDLVVAKQNTFLSSCIPSVPDSPGSEISDSDSSSIKKSFSFRDKFSRISFLRRDKDKKVKTIVEHEVVNNENNEKEPDTVTHQYGTQAEQENRASKRFWFFRNKEIKRRTQSPPIYKRSKSFEFLPKALEEDEEDFKPKLNLKTSYSTLVFSSTESMGDAWASNDSLDFLSTKPEDKEDMLTLYTVKEYEPASTSSKSRGSSLSTMTSSNSSGMVGNIFQRDSVQDLLDEFDKTVEMFNENYLSDCETYTKKPAIMSKNEKRKSSSFSTLPSPRIVQVNPLKPRVSAEFMRELSVVIRAKHNSVLDDEKTIRRGSVTDWFILEEPASTVDDNKYRRAQRKKPVRVRRISSTKYWITPEECAVYSRDQRPPLVIPRISQHRPRIERTHFNIGLSYPEDTLPDSPPGKYPGRQNDGYQDWSPTSERGYDLDRYSKASSDSPPFIRTHKKLGGSTENLLNLRRPTHLHLPASSSGEGLDVDVRVKSPWETRNRKSKSVMVPKHSRSPAPTPAPRSLLPGNNLVAPVIYEGQVKRTKFMENTKKCKKHWTDCYMVLTNTKLICFKDYKNYLATKNPPAAGTPPSPNAPRAEIILPLKNAYVISCIQMHTRRFTKSLMLTVGYDTYLLQFESEEIAKRWLSLIQNIIYQLGPPIDDISSQHLYLSSNTDLESLGRTPPVTRHNNRNKTKAGGSSNEDLSDSTEPSIQKHHTRSKLRKFFAKRPSKEMLEKRGIYKDEPVFGRNLSEVCPSTSPRVPEFVVACIREIEKTEENLCTDGLYRASGNLSQVQKIRLQIDQNNISVIENSPDIHVLAGSLKLFFRELKEPLIPCNVFLRVLAASSLKPREARIKEFRDIVQSLPQCNKDTLKFLLEHLLKVTKRSDQNRMHIANLAIVFGPTLLWAPAEQAYNIAIDCIQQNNVVDILLTDFKEIFAEDNVKAKKKA